MSTIFYTKKSKAKWRARKRKKEKAMIANGIDNDQEVPSYDNNGSGSEQKNSSDRKRSANEISGQQNDHLESAHDVHKKAKHNTHQQQTNTIVIPANLTSKEAKKFRKDARRKARADGQSDELIKFIIEGQKEEPSSTTTNNKEGGEEDDDKQHSKQQIKKKTKKVFPRINDILSQEAAQKKLNDKLSKQTQLNNALPPSHTNQYIAIDCEMVGIGIDGKKSALARVSIVNWSNDILLDTFVRVNERVTDFRTHVSGVRSKDIHVNNEKAIDPNDCRQLVGKILMNKILVGHGLKNDLSVLMLDHPRCDVRDTSRYKPFMRPSGRGGGKLRPRKLRDLVYENLGKRIQVDGEAHCSIDDARASMELFKVVKSKWEKELDEKYKKKGKKMLGGDWGKK